MGICPTRPQARKPQARKPQPRKQVDNYEDLELSLLRTAIAINPDAFILNNLMMCIQFFENYEEDIIQIKETLASSYEAELNKKLPPQKHILLPDILQKYIERNVIFTSKRQTGNLIIEPLQPVRIYVVYDNIEITEQHYQPEYSSLNNGITYNMMVQSSEYPGYVRLRCLDEMPYSRNLSKKEDIDSSANNDKVYYSESAYGDSESLYYRHSNMMLPHQMKTKNLQTSNTRSCPNLHDDETMHKDQIFLSHENIYRTRSDRDIKIDFDCKHMSSVEHHQRNYGKKNKLRTRKERYRRQLSQFDTAKLVKAKERRPPSSSSSGYRSDFGTCDSDSEPYWNYHTVTPSVSCNMNRNKMVASSTIYSNAMIPRQCFKKVKINNRGKIYTTRDKRKQAQNSTQLRLEIAYKQYDCEVFYTSSEMFMSHFVELFANQLAKRLDFKQVDLNHVENSVIHCKKIIESHNSKILLPGIESYEITPTIWLQWPKDAEEWLDRPRSTWPHYDDINKVKDFGCYVVPEDSSYPKQRDLTERLGDLRHQNVKKNIHQEIEWQLVFPAAERYLETCLTRSQVQVYLIALMLHKTFLRPVQDTMHGLTTSHIRNKLFWLIEENDLPSEWSDNRTGECLIKLLDSLYSCISQDEKTLPDYFVRDRNMLNKVPSDYLLRSQKQLKRIIQNPILYVLHAMENIKYYNKQFFPQLDFANLFKILTFKQLLSVNTTLGMPKTKEEFHRKEIHNKSNGFCDTARIKDQQNYSTRINADKTLITSRKATDFIVEIEERCVKLEGLRLFLLLEFFVRHFIKMAECCHRYKSYQQMKVYLDQADRLSIILSDHPRYKNDAKSFRDKIQTLRMRAMSNSTRLPNKPPETPKRNVEPTFSCTWKDRFTQPFAEQIVPMQSKDKPLQSDHECINQITKTIIHEVQFKDEENAEKNVKTANATINDEDSYISKKSISKNQNDELASSTNQRVISLEDHLSETYI